LSAADFVDVGGRDEGVQQAPPTIGARTSRQQLDEFVELEDPTRMRIRIHVAGW
jgi:hypothetical protein